MFNPQPKPEPKKQQKRIRRRSNKRAAQERKYNANRIVFIQKNPVCAVSDNPATQVHHMKGRDGDLLLDERFWLPVSADAHEEIERNPKWAFDMGYSLSRIM